MKAKCYDVIIAKEYNTVENGQPVRRTAWNRVGQAWDSKTGDSISLELFHIPNQRFVISPKKDAQAKTPNPDEIALSQRPFE